MILPAVNARRPVFLVHGYLDTCSKLVRVARRLWTLGFDVFTPTLRPSCGQLPISEMAEMLSGFIRSKVGEHQPIDIVGFSMGGLICRHYIQRLGGLERTGRLVTISTPHFGTAMAHTLDRPGCRDMRFGSPFLRDLNSDIETLKRADFTSFWTPFDLIIVPATSSITPVSRNIRLMMPIHPQMVLHPRAIDAVTGIVTAPLPQSAARDEDPRQIRM